VKIVYTVLDRKTQHHSWDTTPALEAARSLVASARPRWSTTAGTTARSALRAHRTPSFLHNEAAARGLDRWKTRPAGRAGRGTERAPIHVPPSCRGARPVCGCAGGRCESAPRSRACKYATGPASLHIALIFHVQGGFPFLRSKTHAQLRTTSRRLFDSSTHAVREVGMEISGRCNGRRGAGRWCRWMCAGMCGKRSARSSRRR
jgi:hypothetical protein